MPDATPPALYVGLDLSTQQLKFAAIRADSLATHVTEAVNFDAELPEFGTTNGVIASQDGREVVAPTLMFVKALDLLFEKLKARGFPFAQVQAMSFSGQQHGSAFWSSIGVAALPTLDPTLPLHSQLPPFTFSTPTAPTWQDTSTTALCRSLEAHLGGAANLSRVTGSVAYERFTGLQFGKVARERPDVWANTVRAGLLSSMLASLFLQRVAPIDKADGSGMNLMDVRTGKWDRRCLEWVEADVDEVDRKLGKVVGGLEPIGVLGEYWQRRYGMKAIPLLPSTGDNPSSLTSFPLPPSHAVVSLGTSDTLFLPVAYPPTTAAPPGPGAHLMAHPLSTSHAFVMTVFRNGSASRDAARASLPGANPNWADFDAAALAAPAGLAGHIGVFLPHPEIHPAGAHGTFRFSPTNSPVASFPDPTWDARASLEGKFLAMRARLASMGVSEHGGLEGVVLVGGAAASRAVREVAAGVFGCPCYVLEGVEGGDAAAVGAALRAAYYCKAGVGKEGDGAQKGGDVVEGFARMFEGSAVRLVEVAARPAEEVAKVYDGMVGRWEEVESKVVAGTS